MIRVDISDIDTHVIYKPLLKPLFEKIRYYRWVAFFRRQIKAMMEGE